MARCHTRASPPPAGPWARQADGRRAGRERRACVKGKVFHFLSNAKSCHKCLSDGEIWTAHGGVNPCGLVVQRGDRELRTRWLC
jgi:hypothetical protein